MTKYSVENLFKQTRESKGISLEMVHDATKIPMDVLKGIEEGYQVGTISKFYYKGFLKLYAKYLNINAEQVAIFEEKRNPTVTPSKPKPDPKPAPVVETSKEDGSQQKSPQKESLFSEKIKDVISQENKYKKTEIIDGVIGRNKISFSLGKKQKQLIVQVVGGLLVLFIVIKVFGFIGGLFARGKKDAPKPIAGPVTVEQPIASQPMQAGNVDEPIQKDTSSSQVFSARNVELTVRAKKSTWLQVKADGVIVFQSIIKAGITESWSADKEIELSGRNIQQMEMELNGKVLGALSKRGRRVSKVVVTKTGLYVKE